MAGHTLHRSLSQCGTMGYPDFSAETLVWRGQKQIRALDALESSHDNGKLGISFDMLSNTNSVREVPRALALL